MVWSLTFVIVLEVTVERGRGVTGGIVNIGWNIGSMLMTLSAFALRSWHWMQLANAVFSLLLVLYYVLVPGWLLDMCCSFWFNLLNPQCLLPESPRWLLENGRPEDARSVYLKIARRNGVEVGENFERNFAQLKDIAKEEQEAAKQKSLSESFKKMISVPEFRRRAMVKYRHDGVQNDVA